MKTSFLGTGLMGYPMVERLLGHGYEVFVWNRTDAKARGLVASGACVVSTAKEAIASADLVILMLADAQAVEDVLFSREEISLEGKTVLQMGTIAPQESIGFQKKVRSCQGVYLECPVLGSRNEARDGRLILMVGADSQEFQQWQSFLAVFGDAVYHAGDVGQAAALKLALNQLIAAHAVSFAFSLALVQSNGVDVNLFREILKKSTLSAPMFERKLPNWLNRDFQNPNFPTKHLLKDVRLIQKVAADNHLAMNHVSALEVLFARAVNGDLADLDYSSILNEIAPVPHD